MIPTAMRRIFDYIFTTNSAFWLEKNLDEELADYQAKISVKIDMNSTNQTIEWLKNQEQSWLVHPKEIDAAIKYNHIWPSIRINGKIIGSMKIGFGNVYIVDYNKVIKLPEKMAFIYDMYILPDQRGKGTAQYFKSRVIKFLKSQGYTRVGSHNPPWNKAILRINEKMKFKKVSYVRFFRIFGIPIRIASCTRNFSILKGGRIMKGDLPYE